MTLYSRAKIENAIANFVQFFWVVLLLLYAYLNGQKEKYFMDVFAILHKNIETLMCVVVKLADERATAVVLAEVAIQLV